MGDHVAVDVGELVASRAREAAGLMPSGKEEAEALIGMVECRICQEEDLAKNLESPCACNGSLKVRAPLFVFKQDILDFWFQYMLLILFASDSCYYYSWL
jgi:hypothetical protein